MCVQVRVTRCDITGCCYLDVACLASWGILDKQEQRQQLTARGFAGGGIAVECRQHFMNHVVARQPPPGKFSHSCTT